MSTSAYTNINPYEALIPPPTILLAISDMTAFFNPLIFPVKPEHGHPTTTMLQASAGFLSSLISPLSFTLSEDSDILTVGF
ncbi:hypothetical protein PQX77_013165 [Marasmius sp. AFHP31]|nr:hypothetical protein PQX77_013165 [Marasmius sp. AFHP31]